MAIHFFSASRLADDILHERLSVKDRAYYMLTGMIFNMILGYSTLVFCNSIHTWIGIFEFLLLIVSTVFGFTRCYIAADGDKEEAFILNFVCFSLPIGITTAIAVWGSYWIWWRLYQYIVTSISYDSQDIVKTVLWVNHELPPITVLLAVVFTNVIFFLRMISNLKKARKLK